jgi:DNA-binding PadR family transcriptional regulator
MGPLILGLLMLRDFTVYEIQSFLRTGMYLMYSDSLGSIQVALAKLLKADLVAFSEHVENGRNKKVYTITDAGRGHFQDWLSEPFSSAASQSRVLTKIFFLGMLTPKERESVVSSYVALLDQKLGVLISVKENADAVPVDDSLADVAAYQIATIQLAVDMLRHEAGLFTSLLETIRTEDQAS